MSTKLSSLLSQWNHSFPLLDSYMVPFSGILHPMVSYFEGFFDLLLSGVDNGGDVACGSFSFSGSLSCPNSYDLLLVIPLFIIITMGRIISEHIFYYLGCFLVSINQPEFPSRKPDEFRTKMIRFKEQTFKCLFHAIVAVWSWWSFSSQLWWVDPRFTMITSTSVMSFSVMHKFFYLFQMSFHLHSLIYHYIERRNHKRDDDVQMQVHHFATLFLLLGSFHQGYLRVGTLVLFFHDASDVFVALTKMANYTKHSTMVLVVLLTNMIFSWAYYRLYKFPTDTILVVMEHIGFANKGLFSYSLLAGLIVLEILHWIWFYQIIHIPMAIVAGNEEYDTTENWKEATKQKEAKNAAEKRRREKNLQGDCHKTQVGVN